MFLLLLGGDVEENPGPGSNADAEAMLKNILTGQTAIREDIKEIRESFTKKIDSLSQKFQKLEEEVLSLRIDGEEVKRLDGTIRDMARTISMQQEKLVDLEDRSRRNNLVVFGIPEPENETHEALKEKMVDSIFRDKLGVTVRSVERIHRLGARREGKTRPVIMKLFNSSEKAEILKNCRKLKGTRISINNDYSQATIERRRLLWASARSEKESGSKVQLIHDKLKINSDLYFWNDGSKCRERVRHDRYDKA